jgi:hypothetical protein
MRKTDKQQVCFASADGTKLICNAIDRFGDGQLWETTSGKWIPVPLDAVKGKTATAFKQ